MVEYIDKLSVYKEACAGCTCHGDEIGSCFSSEPCEKLCIAFASARAADVAPVVRCKNCKYWHTIDCALDYAMFEPTDDSFCSYGKAKMEVER